jgi:hypothetical protein
MQKSILFILSSVSLLFAGVNMHLSVNVPVPEIVFPEPPHVVIAAPGVMWSPIILKKCSLSRGHIGLFVKDIGFEAGARIKNGSWLETAESRAAL